MIIGLTGLIGSGKSEVAAVWKKMGARIISGDDLGREAVEKDSVVLYRLVMEFGSTILDKNKKLDRRQLGRLAFSSDKSRDILNSIVHPALLKLLDQQIKEAGRKKIDAVVDAALLIFWGYQKKMDCTVLVTSTYKNRSQRLRRNGLTSDEISQRTASQLSESKLRKHADYIITNNKDLPSLQRKARILYSQLTERG